VAALFAGDGARARAEEAARALAARRPAVMRAHAVREDFAAPAAGDAGGGRDARLRNNPSS
jgi:hypothetical protein